jgi:hypothetical protein
VTPVRYRPRVWGRAVAAMAAGWLVVAFAPPPRVFGQPEYALYYRFDVPSAIVGLGLSDSGTKRTYNGNLRGTLGGIPVTDAKYTYATGASTRAGGGTFSMTTKAGPVRNGQVLMTNEGAQTTLLFIGTYLGAHLSFAIVGTGDQIGGNGVTADGLAETGLSSHDRYIAAVQEATAPLPKATRDQIVAQADLNPRLVLGYQQKSSPR